MAEIDGTTLDRLYRLIASRKGGDAASSYTAQLFAQGGVKIAQKFGEEAIETVIEGARGNAQGVVAESADLLYHLLVLWAASGVAPQDVWRALDARAGSSGIAEKKSRPAPERGDTHGL
jgi:phosphoribosyl-ATP pyrophosphohydrolase